MKIDTDIVYFHGHNKRKPLMEPSLLRPFYLSDNFKLAKIYTTWTEPVVYVITLKEGTEAFNFRKGMDIPKLKGRCIYSDATLDLMEQLYKETDEFTFWWSTHSGMTVAIDILRRCIEEVWDDYFHLGFLECDIHHNNLSSIENVGNPEKKTAKLILDKIRKATGIESLIEYVLAEDRMKRVSDEIEIPLLPMTKFKVYVAADMLDAIAKDKYPFKFFSYRRPLYKSLLDMGYSVIMDNDTDRSGRSEVCVIDKSAIDKVLNTPLYKDDPHNYDPILLGITKRLMEMGSMRSPVTVSAFNQMLKDNSAKTTKKTFKDDPKKDILKEDEGGSSINTELVYFHGHEKRKRLTTPSLTYPMYIAPDFNLAANYSSWFNPNIFAMFLKKDVKCFNFCNGEDLWKLMDGKSIYSDATIAMLAKEYQKSNKFTFWKLTHQRLYDSYYILHECLRNLGIDMYDYSLGGLQHDIHHNHPKDATRIDSRIKGEAKKLQDAIAEKTGYTSFSELLCKQKLLVDFARNQSEQPETEYVRDDYYRAYVIADMIGALADDRYPFDFLSYRRPLYKAILDMGYSVIQDNETDQSGKTEICIIEPSAVDKVLNVPISNNIKDDNAIIVKLGQILKDKGTITIDEFSTTLKELGAKTRKSSFKE